MYALHVRISTTEFSAALQLQGHKGLRISGSDYVPERSEVAHCRTLKMVAIFEAAASRETSI